MGLRVVSGRKPPSGVWNIAIRTIVLAADVDLGGGVAAVWMRRRGLRGRPALHLCLYERIGQRWELVGGGCSEPASLAERSPVTGVLSIISSGGVRSLADRMRRSAPGPYTDVGWVSCIIFLLGSHVDALLAEDRRIAVPAHGYSIVAWKGPPADQLSGRPRIAAVGRDGAVLTELGTRDRFDTATIAGLIEELRD